MMGAVVVGFVEKGPKWSNMASNGRLKASGYRGTIDMEIDLRIGGYDNHDAERGFLLPVSLEKEMG